MKKQQKKLIMRAAGRDPDAFTELVHQQENSLYRTAYAILQNDADAADALQETVLTIWEKLETLRQPEYFKTWCTRILINCCLDIRKQRSTEVPLEACAEPSAEDAYTIEWKEALASIDEKYRVVMEMFYGQGYKISEIAQVLGISENTVKSRLSRGRKRIRRYYDGKGEADGQEV